MIYRLWETLLEGRPGLEDQIQDEWRIWKDRWEEPNILVHGIHEEWLIKSMEMLQRLHKQYDCRGDYRQIFIEHLIQTYGMKRLENIHVPLSS